MFPHKIPGVHQVNEQEYAQRVFIYQSGMDYMPWDSGFYAGSYFSDKYVFLVSEFGTLRTVVLGTLKREILRLEPHSKKLNKLIVMRADGVVHPYYSNNETVRAVD